MQFTPNGIRFSVPLSDQIKTRLTKIEAALFSEGIRNAEDLANHPELSRLLVRLIDACSQRQGFFPPLTLVSYCYWLVSR